MVITDITDTACLSENEQNEMIQDDNQVDGKYEIVERSKRPKVLKWMINSIIILMVAIVITSTLCTMTLNILRSNFNWYNIFTADVRFKLKTETDINNDTLAKLNSTVVTVDSFTLYESKFVYENDYEINVKDLKYLITKEVDKSKTIWKTESISVYMLQYPEISEAIAIIWLLMTIIYQCGHKDANWGIPEGWRIVVPSIIVFFIMATYSSIVTMLGVKAFSHFCTQLKKQLIEPDLVRCGLAIHHLRLQVKSHDFNFDTILNIYHRTSYIKAFCWTLSFIVILLRFLFAIDFQLIELKMIRYEKPQIKPRFLGRDSYESIPPTEREFLSVNTIYNNNHNTNTNEKTDSPAPPKKVVSINDGKTNNQYNKKYYDTEDDEIEDFQSASSIMVRSPLMEGSGDYIHLPH